MAIRLLLPISLETVHDPKEPVMLRAFKIVRHAKLCPLSQRGLTEPKKRAVTQLENANLTDTRRSRQKHIKV